MPVARNSFIHLKQVDSTNNYAMAMVHAGMAKHGDAWFSSNQTAGKGQRGRYWQTGNGENIAISIVISPAPLTIPQQFYLSAAVAVACIDFFNEYTTEKARIKWPNDIYWRDRKAGGILIENIIGSSTHKEAAVFTWKYAIAGIGFNINQTFFSKEIPNAISLKQVTGKHFDLIEVARKLHQHVLTKVEAIKNSSLKMILQEYNSHLYKINELVKLKKQNIVFETKIDGVLDNGQLFTTDTIDNYFNFGEVEWIIENPPD